ncbi:MAG TPA: hypothetical protein VIK34_04780 [Clostridiaceae bacterium]
MADTAEKQLTTAILFEDKEPGSPSYGAMALGTQGFMIADAIVNDEWDWRTFGNGKGFTADLIVLGHLLGGSVDFDLNQGILKISHTDGSYSLLDANGIRKHVGSTNQDYHYLSEAGSVTIPSTNGIATFDITLDPAFKGKNFKVKVSIANSLNSSPYMGESLVSFACYVNSLDIANGKATITGYTRWYDARELIGDQINGTSTAQFYFSDLIVTWVAIA